MTPPYPSAPIAPIPHTRLSEVTEALAELRKTTAKPYKIGPSFAFAQAVQSVGMQAPSIKKSRGVVKAKRR